MDASRFRATIRTLRQWARYAGPGWLFCVCLLDPGNLFSDVQSGSEYAYSQLWVQWWSQLFLLFTGWLCARLVLCCVPLQDFAHVSAKHYRQPPVGRYVLWALAELVVVAADIPEVIGYGFGAHILFGIPVWAGVLLSASSTAMVLLLEWRDLRLVEVVVSALLLALGVFLVASLALSGADAGAFFYGWAVPTFRGSHAAYDALDIVGSVIMPHNLYLLTGSLVTHHMLSFMAVRMIGHAPAQERTEQSDGQVPPPPAPTVEECGCGSAGGGCGCWRRAPSCDADITEMDTPDGPSGLPGVASTSRTDAENDRESDKRQPPLPEADSTAAELPPVDTAELTKHVRPYTLEMVVPVLFAFFVNAAVTAIAAAHVYPLDASTKANIGLYNFCDYLPFRGACVLWGLTLMASGQVSTITTTLTGSYVMKGFLNLQMPLFLRAVLSRGAAILPGLVVAAATSEATVNSIIGVVNAFLSFALPVVLVPLLRCTDERRRLHWFPKAFGWMFTAFVYGLNVYSLYAPAGGILGQYAGASDNFRASAQANIMQDIILIGYTGMLAWLAFT